MNKLLCCYSQYNTKRNQFMFRIKYIGSFCKVHEDTFLSVDWWSLSTKFKLYDVSKSDKDKIDFAYAKWCKSPESLVKNINECKKCKERFKCYTRS